MLRSRQCRGCGSRFLVALPRCPSNSRPFLLRDRNSLADVRPAQLAAKFPLVRSASQVALATWRYSPRCATPHRVRADLLAIADRIYPQNGCTRVPGLFCLAQQNRLTVLERSKAMGIGDV